MYEDILEEDKFNEIKEGTRKVITVTKEGIYVHISIGDCIRYICGDRNMIVEVTDILPGHWPKAGIIYLPKKCNKISLKVSLLICSRKFGVRKASEKIYMNHEGMFYYNLEEIQKEDLRYK